MVTYHNRPIWNGTAFRDGKLYDFQWDRGIIVARQWPDMRAWRKTPKGRHWQHIRPVMILEKKPDGWSCIWGKHESRQPHHSNAGHILGRMEEGPTAPRAFEERVPFDETGLEGSLGNEEDDEPGSEYWKKRARLDYADERNHQALAQYLSPIPEEILTTVSRFANRHWHLLNLIARCPGAFDLARSTPALALAISSPWVFRHQPPSHPLRSARSLLRKRQTEIASWLGFPSAWSTVKILRKLPPGECTVLNLLQLRDLFRTHLKILQHLPGLNGSIIRLLSGERDRYRASPGFLQEMTSSTNLVDCPLGILRDTLWMRKKLEDTEIITLRSFKHLTRTHDHFVDRMGRMDLRIIDPLPFPPAPLPTSSPYLELESLQTEIDLLEEGRVQQNCVGAYGTRIRRGMLHLYRLLEPERATVAVKPGQSGKWELAEIKAYQNAEVAPETVAAVIEWIESAGRPFACECDDADMPF